MAPARTAITVRTRCPATVIAGVPRGRVSNHTECRHDPTPRGAHERHEAWGWVMPATNITNIAAHRLPLITHTRANHGAGYKTDHEG